MTSMSRIPSTSRANGGADPRRRAGPARLEAQYQDAVRLQINNLYTAFVDVLAARETVRYAEASVKGLDKVLQVTQRLYERLTTTRPDVFRMRILREAAEVGSRNAHERPALQADPRRPPEHPARRGRVSGAPGDDRRRGAPAPSGR